MAKQLPENAKAKGANSAARKQAPAPSVGRQRLWRDLALIAIAPLLLYLLACLFTYSPDDPGWSKSGSLTAPIQNLGGHVGARLADVLLYLCGYVAFLLPVILGVIAWIAL
ncbi:MAG TPA: DNA translocase FtsK 4TM domain-containing protein, partial [Pseudoxanthomonas sp.]|nr:DNA translocase FtsK 4TM domain-containing protein [Pseudoxanthomonas sp.]